MLRKWNTFIKFILYIILLYNILYYYILYIITYGIFKERFPKARPPDDVSQGQQPAVDAHGLLEPHAAVACPLIPLGACDTLGRLTEHRYYLMKIQCEKKRTLETLFAVVLIYFVRWLKREYDNCERYENCAWGFREMCVKDAFCDQIPRTTHVVLRTKHPLELY